MKGLALFLPSIRDTDSLIRTRSHLYQRTNFGPEHALQEVRFSYAVLKRPLRNSVMVMVSGINHPPAA